MGAQQVLLPQVHPDLKVMSMNVDFKLFRAPKPESIHQI